jgi:hypothetical protein
MSVPARDPNPNAAMLDRRFAVPTRSAICDMPMLLDFTSTSHPASRS